MRKWLALLLLGLHLGGGCAGSGDGDDESNTSPTTSNTTQLTVTLRPVATGLASPTFVTHAGDARMFLVEQPGRVRLLLNGTLLDTPFLDITSLVSSGGERGLLSMAFHPQYGTAGAPGAGLFWVNYTDLQGGTVIARYSVSPTASNQADSTSALELLRIPQPFANHNGGQLQFGPAEGVEQQRYLYIGMGDGGSGGDPQNHAQRDDSVLGKMLRLAPSTATNPPAPFYTVPPDNPNPATGVLLGTIWAKGLRNPWRFSFDALTGDLYIADVGQGQWEEIHMTPAETPGGLNYGWRIMEGPQCFNPPSNCDMRGLVPPVFAYSHAANASRCAIIGGYVYRGRRFPALTGLYLYADLCSGEIFGLSQTPTGTWESVLLAQTSAMPLTFGEDVDGEVYLGSNDGHVYQITVAE